MTPATFDGPGRAIRCAAAVGEELRGLGITTRMGLHTGEVEMRLGDVGGIGVHIAARVMAAADPEEILVKDGAGLGRRVRHHARGPRNTPPQGRPGELAAVRGGEPLTCDPASCAPS